MSRTTAPSKPRPPGWFYNELPDWPNRIEAPGPEYASLSPAERLARLPWLAAEEALIDDPNAAFSRHICGCITAYYILGQQHYKAVVRGNPAARHMRDRLEWLEAEGLSTARLAEAARKEQIRQTKLAEAAAELLTAAPPPPAPAPPAKRPPAKRKTKP